LLWKGRPPLEKKKTNSINFTTKGKGAAIRIVFFVKLLLYSTGEGGKIGSQTRYGSVKKREEETENPQYSHSTTNNRLHTF